NRKAAAGRGGEEGHGLHERQVGGRQIVGGEPAELRYPRGYAARGPQSCHDTRMQGPAGRGITFTATASQARARRWHRSPACRRVEGTAESRCPSAASASTGL